VPPALEGKVVRGSRVLVPLRNGNAVALVTGLSTRTPEGVTLKPIARVLDPGPFYDEAAMKFLAWVGEYYLAPPGLVLRAAWPSSVRKARKREAGPAETLPERAFESDRRPRLTAAQDGAVEALSAAVKAGREKVFLLHGVTASGKTEVYMRAAEAALARGMSSLILVPEIAMSYQIVGRFKARFGDAVTVLHSRLTGVERSRAAEASRFKPGIVVGARSAVFAPLPRLGFIAVDEEHEGAYKQEETVPFYHARDCAIVRARHSSCPVVLGSATPSLEAAARAKAGQFTLLELPERIDATPLPATEIVPMAKVGPGDTLSPRLIEALKEAVGRGEQAILFLNRRGFAPVFLCTACGKAARCSACSANLVLHVGTGELACHWCGRRTPAVTQCAGCGSSVMKALGAGTQRVEQEVKRLMPGAKLVRMDLDTTRQRTAHRDLLEEFSRGDILVGTQMVAKGLDFPRLSLVGIVNADASLVFPDFRAAERTFQLLTQVAGRAGRRDRQGLVLIQTNSPEHPAIVAAARNDYWGFFAAEASTRKALGYPPFGRLVRVKVTGMHAGEVERSARVIADSAARSLPASARVLGPAPAIPEMVARRTRWHLTVKGPLSADIRGPVAAAVSRFNEKDPTAGRLRISIDVDPVNVMS
jgi:primosomal protein N' (replication factor Y)